MDWYLKQVIYRQDIRQFYSILKNNGIDKSVDILRNSRDFKKSVLLKLHPDKGGNNEDFIFVITLQEKFSTALDIKNILDNNIKGINSVIHKAAIKFKILDTIVDSTRLICEPTIINTKKVVIDSAYLYSMYQGANGYSLVISAADILYQTYQREYTQALTHVLMTIGYMVLPSIVSYISIPYLGIVYGIIITTYTGYSAVVNLQSFYKECTSIKFALKSATAYKYLAEVLSESPLQLVYDFATTTKEYQVQINNLNLIIEKAVIKTMLEEKEEFGQKLYDSIYAPFLEEKYNLMNKMLQSSLRSETAESMKAKHLTITTSDQSYMHCLEIKNTEDHHNSGDNRNHYKNHYSNTHTTTAHYYCYNAEQQVLERVILGKDNEIIVIEHW
jgi:hypothetical protein